MRETVPDSVIDRADDIELIDLTPDDLIQRLRDGKVYVPPQAERAVRHYFAPGNLTALRELALRRTAQRVDDQMVDYMRSHAIEGPWPAGERVLVCVAGRPACHRHRAPCQAAGRPASRALDRAQRRDGRCRQAPAPAEQDSVAEALRLAQQLGGEPVLIPGQDVADHDHRLRARQQRHPRHRRQVERPAWREWLTGSVTRQVINRAGGINIHVIEAPVERKPGNAAAAVDGRDQTAGRRETLSHRDACGGARDGVRDRRCTP